MAMALFHSKFSAESRLQYAFGQTQADALEKIGFASQWPQIEGDLPWEVLKHFAQTADLPESVTFTDFHSAASQMMKANCRRFVANPLVGATMDFFVEIETITGESQESWKDNLLSAAARVKANGKWAEEEPLDPASIGDEVLPGVAKALAKLWPQRAPDWATAIREKDAKRKEAAKAQKVLEKEAAAAEGGQEKEGDQSADGQAKDSEAAGDGQATLPAAVAAGGGGKMAVGDIICLDTSVSRKSRRWSPASRARPP